MRALSVSSSESVSVFPSTGSQSQSMVWEIPTLSAHPIIKLRYTTNVLCKWSMRFFQDDQNMRKIVFSVFSNILCTASRYSCEGNTEKGSSLIIWQMDFAAQKVLIPRQHVLSIFSECWQFLKRRDLEEVLIPIGWCLALSLVSKGYKSKAVTRVPWDDWVW